jgi:cytochrome P450
LSIFQALLDSKLPESEKSTERLFSESRVLLAAGTDTTGMMLTRIVFHLLSNLVALKRLKKELEIAIPGPNILPTSAQVENLLYFVSRFLVIIYMIIFIQLTATPRTLSQKKPFAFTPAAACAL